MFFISILSVTFRKLNRKDINYKQSQHLAKKVTKMSTHLKNNSNTCADILESNEHEFIFLKANKLET